MAHEIINILETESIYGEKIEYARVIRTSPDGKIWGAAVMLHRLSAEQRATAVKIN